MLLRQGPLAAAPGRTDTSALTPGTATYLSCGAWGLPSSTRINKATAPHMWGRKHESKH